MQNEKQALKNTIPKIENSPVLRSNLSTTWFEIKKYVL